MPPPPKDGGGGADEQPTFRRDTLLRIQEESRKKWDDSGVFVSDAPASDDDVPAAGKFFGNFPYPYMNGLLHLGHAFSLSKLEFASAYHRLCGKRVLFPQGFHCTGMPIKACADRLARELDMYGCPPVFPDDDAKEEEAGTAANGGGPAAAGEPPAAGFKGKKSKAAAKQGKGKTQWEILQQSGIPESEIPRFRDTAHWLKYFPPLAKRDMAAMGCGIDWRRSFITTDANPYYDSFVQWQFRTLLKQGRVYKDKRYTVYSPLDGQPCADHDRASGEGANPQEYTLVKLEVLELKGKLAQLENKGRVFLLAATLRPETMYAQTNCWALPEGRYGAFRGMDGEVYVMTERSALNLSYQDRMPVTGKPELLLELTGQDLMGLPLRAGNAQLERIYVLPLLTIKTDKGTGVVTSVPSDAPDDYVALQELKAKPKLREKFGIADEWVLPFEVMPVIHVPGYGDKAAEKLCTDMKITSQNDREKLAEAKDILYKKGFYDGEMVVGPYKGQKVSEAKPKIRDEMIAAKDAILYSEPERKVMSRSGDECVVALTDQWYITYGEEEWLEITRKALAEMELYSEEARHGFEHTLGWLSQWACSRSFGLGTRLPWDPQFLVESLSDSTIYMAYYTVAHFLQNNDMYGQKPGDIKAEDMTDAVWDSIFLAGPPPADSPIPPETLAAMRREFEFWYPFDLRVSGKDLIQNHLTFALYSHTAVWGPDKWPRAFRTNGHLLLNSDKMSKSTGNFLTLQQGLAMYTADVVRVVLANSGDGMDDGNFEEKDANANILRLTKELAWTEEVLNAGASLRTGEYNFHDRVFDNELDITARAARRCYDAMLFRDALQVGWFSLLNARDRYRFACDTDGLHRDVVLRYIDVQTRLLAPICPHTCEHVWGVLLQRPGSVLTAGWPDTKEPDLVLAAAAAYLEGLIPSLRSTFQKVSQVKKPKKGGPAPPPAAPPNHIDLFVAARFGGWQEAVLTVLARHYDTAAKGFPDEKAANAAVLEAAAKLPEFEGLSEKDLKKKIMPFVKYKVDEAVKAGPQVLAAELPFKELDLLKENGKYLLTALKLSSIEVHQVGRSEDEPPAVQSAEPGKPVAVFKTI